ncbi:hypothetical protein F4604DRAFT_1883326 [Suillus subluteus]|nr:hypothetical protein F4604DRAFT_1883326 [Suillus subluteus]
MGCLVEAYLDYRHRDLGDGMPNCNGIPAASPSDDTQRVSLSEIELIDIFSMYIDCVLLTLIYHGYIGCAPVYPTVAISLRTLAAYQQMHCVCPSFGFQAQCKALCFLHGIPYRPYLTARLSSAFDIYLEILHRVDQRLHMALKRDTPNWRLLNSCPACFYKLEDEPNLAFEWLISIDSNNSLKRWDSTTYGMNARLNSRKACSDVWVDAESVDRFSVVLIGGKNAGPETQKKMFLVFDESGIFIAACHHRFVLIACDMIQSGELAKYPLAIIDKLLTVYSKNSACAYDIGCAFTKTLELGFHLMVGAFHGHAHNRMCQLDWHPIKFHQHQMIEQHFAFWNDDKYANLSNFLWNHYCEALKSIETLTVELSAIKLELNITDDDFLCYFEQECAYLHSLKEPPARDQLCICYEACEAANNSLTRIAASSLQKINEVLTQARIQVYSSYVKLQHAESTSGTCQNSACWETRWEVGGPEWNEFKMEARIGKYHAALDELERLVVMCLFELSKLSLSGTGYKLRQQISKALQRHSKAIRNAINRYNTTGCCPNSPVPEDFMERHHGHSFLGEFDLLRHSRAGIHSNDWTKLAHREATNKFFKLCCAHEEVKRLNIEVRRLRTAIHTKELQTSAIINDLLLSDPRLAAELQRQCRPRAAINASIAIA